MPDTVQIRPRIYEIFSRRNSFFGKIYCKSGSTYFSKHFPSTVKVSYNEHGCNKHSIFTNKIIILDGSEWAKAFFFGYKVQIKILKIYKNIFFRPAGRGGGDKTPPLPSGRPCGSAI